ncbi:MAG: tetratricopeptide repeat protein [Acidobacteriota bacterium]
MTARLRFIAIAAILVAAFGGMAVTAQDDEEAADDPAKDAIALFNKGQEAHEKGELKVALDLYAKAIALIPEFPEAELQRGNAFLSLGRTADAETAFRRALDLHPDWTLAMASLGSVLVSKDQNAEAEKLLLRAIELDEQNFPALSALTELRLKTSAKPDVLRDLLHRLMDLTAKSKPTASVWSARAALEDALGSVDAAKLSAEKALALEPLNRTSLGVMFNSAITDGDAARAASFLGRYEKADPASTRLISMRARILLVQGKPVEALAVLNAVANPTPDMVALRDKIATASSTNSAELEKLLETDNKNADALGRLCTMLRTENPAKALDYCRRASEGEPNNITHAIGYGAALVQAKRYLDAVLLFRRILLIAPDNSSVRANLATAYFQLERYDEAKREYEWLTQRQPENAAGFFFLGITHDHLGEFLDAMANYQQFLKIADEGRNGLEIEKVKLRIPSLEKQIKEKRGRKTNAKS